MLDLLWLIPALPFASAFVLMVFGPRMSRNNVAATGVGSIGLSALLSILVAASFMAAPPAGHAFTQRLWTWIDVAGFRPEISLYLDALAVVFLLVITCVGFLIHLYSAEFMNGDEGYSRFFAYMNLFVASMVTLVLADNLLLLYLGWEGVGLCSYLLIGFWYQDPANGLAARKAFLVTRVGDTAMAIGLFVLFYSLGTLHIQEMLGRASAQWEAGAPIAIAAAALLLGGAVGKSAQLPLQTWLPDAMAGPTPTSALIHAATMVTAGVYLIARTHTVFTLAPPVQAAVAVVGLLTLLLAGFSALAQYDIKRVLAYSTISQIGYMFLALGVGAWSAGIFHFMTHAFFKALLFLAAGVVILACHHEHDMFKMGGLRSELRGAYWAFLAGGSALAGLPLITAGFYSKDSIIWAALSSPLGGAWLWAGAVLGALVTSLYIYRLIFLTFFGEMKTHVSHRPGIAMMTPLGVLGVLSIVGGFLNTPHWLGHVQIFSRFLETAVVPFEEAAVVAVSETVSEAVAALAFGVGLWLAYTLYLRNRKWVDEFTATGVGQSLRRLGLAGWGFDWIYDRVFVRPVVWIAGVNRNDFVDSFYTAVAEINKLLHTLLSMTQTGRVRWYAAGIAVGSVLFVAMVLMS